MRTTRFAFHSCIAGLLAAGLAGCGAVPLPGSAPKDSEAMQGADTDCGPAPAEAGTLVVLEWEGGISPLVAGRELTGFDAAALNLAGDEVSGVDNAAFRKAVLARVQTILCGIQPNDVAVIAANAADYPSDTIVHVTGDIPPYGGRQIGQSDFDLCNERADDAVVVWGGALATRIAVASFDEWVNAFANTIAHEIGHTLGFTHPNEQALAQLLPVPTAEVMRGNVKVADLVQEQSFLLEQDTCPGGESYDLADPAR